MSALHYLAIVLLTALFIIFTIQVSEKFGIRDWAISHTHGLLSQMLECDFCLGFWIGVVLSIAMAIILKYPPIIAVPIFSTPLVRYFL